MGCCDARGACVCELFARRRQSTRRRLELAATDRAFARAAADDAQAEVAIAALAQQTTSSDIVRTFTEDMQRVYLEIADELREIGNRKHQALPNVVSADDQVTLDSCLT